MFSADNGFYHGEHRIRDGKHYLYRPAGQVPLIVRGPGFPAGLSVPFPVSNVDLAPTISAMAGATAGRTMDGVDLRSYVLDPTYGASRTVLVEDSTNHSREGVKSAEWHLAKLGGYWELYDAIRDPYELNNLANNPAYAGVLADMQARLAALRACAGDTCRP